jgi:hypothetical protein
MDFSAGSGDHGAMRIALAPSDASTLTVRPPRRRVPRLQDVELPPALKLDGDVVDLLREDRERHR